MIRSLEFLQRSKDFAEMNTLLGEGKSILLYGLSGGQKSYVLAGMLQEKGKRALVITEDNRQMDLLIRDLENLLPDAQILPFPIFEVLPYDVLAVSREATEKRLQALTKLVSGEEVIVVTSVKALQLKLIPPQFFAQENILLRVGESIDIAELTKKLVELGYERLPMVENKGQFSIRGGIIDIFSVASEKPFRIEFFDVEIDSIREFDAMTQRSIGNVPEVLIPPAREIFATGERFIEGKKKLAAAFEKQLAKVAGAAKLTENLTKKMEKAIGEMEENNFTNLEQYLPFFYDELSILPEYLGGEGLIILDEPQRLRERMNEASGEVNQIFGELLLEGKALQGQLNLYGSFSDILKASLKYPVLGVSLLPKKLPEWNPQAVYSFSLRSNLVFHGQMDIFAGELQEWLKRRYTVLLVAQTKSRFDKLAGVLTERGIPYRTDFTEQGVVLLQGALQNGFEFPQLHLAVITDEEIFGRAQHQRRKAKKIKDAAPLKVFTDLKEGDYVVHINHGIGKYMGIETLDAGGVNRDYLLIRYAGEDKLYVPVEQVGLIQKYVGEEGKLPKVNRLGGGEWSKVRHRVKASVEDLAKELLSLYAKRAQAPGFAFSPDTPWQREFEDYFPYEETPDQLQAIAEIKRDMEAPKVMDRLLCGDVGYGKTEVAIRAAFKAVMNGKQVAVLVPTTILAQQHFNTFQERCANFPIKIEVLSRFRSPSEQKKILQDMKLGQVDIVIGTHRLLQKDVKFKDLGLLIVDEEQRFGVAHKEKLKKLKTSVDVLTLTATPIPRTLHMAMVGVRDMSVIETPPENRYPVQTFVMEHNYELIRDVIRRELNREGQVYYVHNRVHDIEKVAAALGAIVPEARIAVGHGQMKEEELENVMLGFMLGEYDVLVCTTIIETGLDIPNVNTIIIDHADKMGLSQLYQLRGRVGRSNRMAFAYLTYEKDKVLSEVAEKRLHAIREFTEFGSGFKIALRDLEIRGAGNILGPEQHGHIVSVGFEMYCRMLEDAIKEMRGERVVEIPEPQMELDIDAYIPDTYVTDPNQKIALYKRIALIEDLDSLREMEDEIMDRYGDLPEVVMNLLGVMGLKILARTLMVSIIRKKGNVCQIQYHREKVFAEEVLRGLIASFAGRLKFQPGNIPTVHLYLQGDRVLLQVKEFLSREKDLEERAVLHYNEGM